MERTWMPTVAGIVDVVSGVFALLGVLGLITAFTVVKGYPSMQQAFTVGEISVIAVSVLLGITIPLAFVGILALVGGICALQRKNWGLALAGSIVAVLFSRLLGIPAIIFIALSKKEFT